MSYFFDTYAIIEMVKGSERYWRYLNYPILTTTMNLAEFYYSLLNEQGELFAKKIISKFNLQFLEISTEVAIEASHFRHAHKKKKLSYVDCVGYVIALKEGYKFLAGDEGFRNIPNVEFVK